MKFVYYNLVLVILLGSIFTSCISSEETNYLQTNVPVEPSKYELTPFEPYVLAVNDNIGCRISTSDQEVRSTFDDVVTNGNRDGLGLVIYEDSTVILPIFGPVKVAGLTIQDAQMKIQDVVQESILDAQVTVSMLSNYFYVFADGQQGRYRVYKENLTIYQALAISGQTTQNMDLSRTKIVRKGEDGRDIIEEFDLRTQDVVESQFYYIQPNDVMYFSKNRNSFFNVTSVNSFFSTITLPLTTLFVISTYTIN